MMQRISFDCEGLALEGLLNPNPSSKGVVIAHPHPLYGGDMHNPVVASMAKAFEKKGYTTLRLNFRGVGNSRGDYDNGEREQKDILAAAAHLTDLGMTRVDLSGYSFGAWVISRLTDLPPAVKQIILVAPPIAMMPFNPSPALDRVKAMITGSEDDIAPAAQLRKLLEDLKSGAKLEVIPGADHFYAWHTDALESSISSFLA
ncbi:MAG: alpha/beta fold hydrolase [Desulfobacteraceae bacterium]|nr:alpha/beta fold hydrolase [Desulfobacteraceae bacterium]MBU4055694.1 alpha/beta fold hydrolase [Pseudomonadota bacterium]